MKKSLLDRLIEYSKTAIPFHTPGHKRKICNSLIPYSIDITEIDGFDNLHDMKGILKDTANLAKKLYNSHEAFPLVNGSTCGVLAGIYSLVRENKNILIARNCHKSVYNATEILDLDAYYVLPEELGFGIWGRVSAEEIERQIKEHDVGTVVITSPTYDGVVSDISAIYEVCKRCGAYLFVDCAHGAHMMDLHNKCDICVMSLHKTLPSLTQTALLNVYSERVDLDKLKHGLSIFETSSPSYVLLASIDEGLRFMEDNKDKFSSFYEELSSFYKKITNLKNIRVTHFDDMCKIIVLAKDGYELCRMLREEKIEVEMASQSYVLLIATVCDTKESLNALSEALFKIDEKASFTGSDSQKAFLLPEKALKISEALSTEGEFVDICDCQGKISLEYIWAYPPGAPIVVPGERISSEIINYLSSKKDLKSTKGKYPKIYAK